MINAVCLVNAEPLVATSYVYLTNSLQNLFLPLSTQDD